LHGSFLSEVISYVPTTKVREVTHMLKAIHERENLEAALCEREGVLKL
jgi:hypothetical protein